MSNHFYYDYPFIMSNLTKSEYSFIMGSLLLRVTSSIMVLLCPYRLYRVSQKKLGSQNFQIALTHSFLKLKSIVIPLNQMSRSGEKICIGLKFNLVHFNGPQTKFKIFEIPVFFDSPCMYAETLGKGTSKLATPLKMWKISLLIHWVGSPRESSEV